MDPKSAFIVHPPRSSTNLHGYIDPSNPHAINRLHIDYLGRKEIVLVACDDGDVIGYYVSSIAYAMENGTEPLPFFQFNMQISAWGLAVHHEARLIAMSSNTHKVAVVAPELTKSTSREERHEKVVTLVGYSNLPSLSFNNNGTDPSGKWLLGSCIDGNTLVWDTTRSSQHAKRNIMVGSCPSPIPLRCGCERFAHGIWGAMFIDKRSAHHCDSIKQIWKAPNTLPARCVESDNKTNRLDTFWDTTPIQFADSPSSGNNSETWDPVDSNFRYLAEGHVELPPIAIVSKREVYLIQQAIGEKDGRPITALEPKRPRYLQRPGVVFNPDDRLVFSHYISELGMLIVGAPSGTVYMITITKFPTSFPELETSNNPLTFRLEHTLPLASQAQKLTSQQWPMLYSLLGIAVGPMQGSLDVNEEDLSDGEEARQDTRGVWGRSWRVMLLYSSHTILSYEVRRNERSGEVGLADLMV